jgi:hypothetical protein
MKIVMPATDNRPHNYALSEHLVEAMQIEVPPIQFVPKNKNH